MMCPQSDRPLTSLNQPLSRTVLCRAGNRRGLAVFAGLPILGGLSFNWCLPVAAGVAPLLAVRCDVRDRGMLYEEGGRARNLDQNDRQ